MSLQLETKDPEVLSGVYAGFDNLQRYKVAGDVASLNRAVSEFQRAASLDPQYFPAVYYQAITQDLSGKSSVAVENLDKLRAELEESFHRGGTERNGPPVPESVAGGLSRQLLEEVRFNLGVAYYHIYTGDNIDKAIERFRQAEASNYSTLPIKLLAKAALAQAWAQKIIQKNVENPDHDALERAFKSSRALTESVRASLEAALEINTETRNDIAWRLENASGCAIMFRSDYRLGDNANTPQISMLKEAVQHFEKADLLSPRNWAVFCNLGSVWMRLGYWERVGQVESDSSSKQAFERGEEYLMRVVKDLRYGYGFAYYELGRLHRLQLNFALAIEFFESALKIPVSDRNVSDKTVFRELERAQHSSDVFP